MGQTDHSISNYTLPDSLKKLDLLYNDITKLPKLPNSLEKLLCHNNDLSYIPKLPDNLNLIFYQNKELDYITYNPKIKILYGTSIKIKGYDKVISNQEEYDEYIKLMYMNKIKSARK